MLVRFAGVICSVLMLGPAPDAHAQADKSAGAKAPSATARVKLATSMGDITLELDAAKAPITVENFLAYVKSGHYNGTVFHRVMSTFMVQGGGFGPELKEKTTRAPIKLESQNGLKNVRGAIAMARTNVPDSAASQFFINVVDNPRLDFPSFDGHGYAVFGHVIEGMDVVDKIKVVAIGNQGPHQNVPTTPVVIRSATLLR